VHAFGAVPQLANQVSQGVDLAVNVADDVDGTVEE
jgi:hypothetical protein